VDRRIPETIAPDYPVFGHGAVPARSDFHYTRARLSEVVEALIAPIDPDNWALDSALLARPGVDEITTTTD
jgi:hypothetical protein